MPRGDGTGPLGFGPMTGRGAGYCAGYRVPGFANPYVGYGPYGRGRGLRRWNWSWFAGGGRGWRNAYYATGLPAWARGWWGWPGWPGYGGVPTPPPTMPSEAPLAAPGTDAGSGVIPGASTASSAAAEMDFLRWQAAQLREGLQGIEARLEELRRQEPGQEDKGKTNPA